MKLNNKKIFLASIVVFLFVVFFAVGSNTWAQSFGSPTSDLDNLAQQSDLGKQDFEIIVGNIIYGILGFLGIISLVLVIVAGVMWIMAEGNEETITKAKGILKGALIGLIVILASYALSYFVVERLLIGTGQYKSEVLSEYKCCVSNDLDGCYEPATGVDCRDGFTFDERSCQYIDVCKSEF